MFRNGIIQIYNVEIGLQCNNALKTDRSIHYKCRYYEYDMHCDIINCIILCRYAVPTTYQCYYTTHAHSGNAQRPRVGIETMCAAPERTLQCLFKRINLITFIIIIIRKQFNLRWKKLPHHTSPTRGRSHCTVGIMFLSPVMFDRGISSHETDR